MPKYSSKETKNYFSDKKARHSRQYGGYRGLLHRRLRNPRLANAIFFLSIPVVLGGIAALALATYMFTLSGDRPSLEQIENPTVELATSVYSADGQELAFFGRQNRSWVPLDSISSHVVHALVAVEDHRFADHWGMDLFRTASAVTQSILWKLGLPFDKQGGSTITQQLARNLYNEQIGFEATVERKLKEMMTAVDLERRYTKKKIVEMYLNTIPFRHNAYGIEAAARTYFGKSSKNLDELESATLVGMLKASTRYDPIRNPENSRQRRNVVLRKMSTFETDDLPLDTSHEGLALDPAFYEAHKDSLTKTQFRSAEVTDSFAPYFAEHVRTWLIRWGRENDRDVFGEGLRVYTTLDFRLQTFAQETAIATMDSLQAAVDCEWSAQQNPRYTYGTDLSKYIELDCHTDPDERFAYFWERHASLLNDLVISSERYKRLRDSGADANILFDDASFMDSLKTKTSRLQTGLVSIDPRTGHIKAWVGGRDLASDWYDHVAQAARQPGSTFKPFVYAAAIDAGYMPWHQFRDSAITYNTGPYALEPWTPHNFNGRTSNELITLQDGLAQSLNTISAQVIHAIKPPTVIHSAQLLGIESPLNPVLSLALGTSEVKLLEMVTAYSTLASLGIRNDPVFVTRIEAADGTVLYEATPSPREALSDQTATLIIDMMRGVIDGGTGTRIRSQYRLHGYDFAGKTGTTQRGADGWFMLAHPELVTGAWVGFNDLQVTFRSSWWGQGAHNALFVVGNYLRRVHESPDVALDVNKRFPPAELYSPKPDDPIQERRDEW